MDVTLGHFSASARADAVVTRRQLLPPKPSVKPRLIFFEPHHDGVAVDVADDVAVTTMTAAHASSASAAAFFVFIVPFSLSSRLFDVWRNAVLRGGDARHPAPGKP